MNTTHTFRCTLSSLVMVFFSSFLFAQADFSQFNAYDDEQVEDLQLTQDQLKEIIALESVFGQQRFSIHQALLYFEDQIVELDKVDKKRNADFQSILTTEQIEAYQNKQVGQSQLRAHNEQMYLKDLISEQAAFMHITDPQVLELIAVLAGGDDIFKFNSDSKIQKKIKEILSREQWKLYKKEKRNQAPKNLAYFRTVEDEETAMRTMKVKMQAIESIYLPGRAAIRGSLEQILTSEEKELLAEWRTAYNNRTKENFSEKTKFKNYPNGPSKEYLKASRNFYRFSSEELLGSPSLIYNFINQDKETFYAAKELALKYDGFINGLFSDLEALENETKEAIILQIPEKKRLRLKLQAVDNIYPNSAMTYERMRGNVAFLLVAPDETNSIISDPVTHQLSVFPNPASTIQTIKFEIEEAGEVTIEMLNPAGRVVQTVFNGNLEAGQHQQEIQIEDIAQSIYFYRLTDATGSSIVKGLKVQ